MAQYAVLIYERVAPGDLPAGGAWKPTGSCPSGSPSRAGGRSPGWRCIRTRRRPRSAATLVTDGPFIETKEVLAGVFVIEARDLDHALALAKLTPIVDGGVEVRPLLGFEIVEAS